MLDHLRVAQREEPGVDREGAADQILDRGRIGVGVDRDLDPACQRRGAARARPASIRPVVTRVLQAASRSALMRAITAVCALRIASSRSGSGAAVVEIILDMVFSFQAAERPR